MGVPQASVLGRRERNKLEKLDRITAAASELFAERGVDEVTTQQIAERADIGAGTLFLYAKTKQDLLLLVQNSGYAEALEVGRGAAESISETLPAIRAVLEPIVTCNRKQIDNGRAYLRELLFGDPTEPHHRDAISYTIQTEGLLAEILQRGRAASEDDATATARAISSVMFVTLASTANASRSNGELLDEIMAHVAVIVPGATPTGS